MNPVTMPPQADRQAPLSYNSGYSHNAYPSRAPDSDSMNTDPIQVASYHNAQFYSSGIYSDPIPVPTGYGQGNDPYGEGSIRQHESNYAALPAGSWGTTAPQPQYHGGYTMPSSQHGSLTQYENNYSGAHFAVDPTPNHTMQLPPFFPGADAVPNNQGTFPIWRLNNCWVSYAEQDELHVTISFRKIAFT